MRHSITTDKLVRNIDVLTPQMVLDQDILPGVSKTWLYDNWGLIGGVTIGNKKFVLKEELYAHLSGNQQKVENEGKGASQRFEDVPASVVSRNGDNQLENSKRGKSSRTGAATAGEGDVLKDHSDDFGFTNLV